MKVESDEHLGLELRVMTGNNATGLPRGWVGGPLAIHVLNPKIRRPASYPTPLLLIDTGSGIIPR